MEKIKSFQVNHLTLTAGLYVSRRDEKEGSVVTTFDLRFVAPNREPVMDMSAIHTIEHLAATYLRNSDRREEVIYFGPMGCRTGFYLVMFGDLTPQDIYETVLKMCDFILSFKGEIPGARPAECGNYLEQNLSMAQYYTSNYRRALTTTKSFTYPA